MKIKINSLTRSQWWIMAGLLSLLPFFVKGYLKMSLPIYGQLDSFELTDTSNTAFGTADLKGHVWVADFIFSRCPGPCPLMSKNMASLHRSFQSVKNVHMVSVSVDPENDTPDALKKYAQKYAVDLKKWHFLTGERTIIRHLLKNNFRVGYQDNIIFHSVYFVLVDDLLRIRGYYDGTDPKELKRLVVDLAFQSKRSRKRQKKMTAHAKN